LLCNQGDSRGRLVRDQAVEPLERFVVGSGAPSAEIANVPAGVESPLPVLGGAQWPRRAYSSIELLLKSGNRRDNIVELRRFTNNHSGHSGIIPTQVVQHCVRRC